MDIDKEKILRGLIGYRDNMTEFDVEEMDYLIKLVKEDIPSAPYVLKFSKAERFDG